MESNDPKYEYVCRMMNENDLEQIEQLEILCFPTPWPLSALRREIKENECARYLVIEKEGEIVAYGGMWFIIDEAHITNFATNPKYRRMGLATQLMKNMIELAKANSVSHMTLEVRVSNTVAQELYRKMGFSVQGTRKKYYSDNNEDAYIMWNNDIDNLELDLRS